MSYIQLWYVSSPHTMPWLSKIIKGIALGSFQSYAYFWKIELWVADLDSNPLRHLYWSLSYVLNTALRFLFYAHQLTYSPLPLPSSITLLLKLRRAHRHLLFSFWNLNSKTINHCTVQFPPSRISPCYQEWS